MILYAIECLGMQRFYAKIGDANHASLRLFERLGFQAHSRSDFFKEQTRLLDTTATQEWRLWPRPAHHTYVSDPV